MTHDLNDATTGAKVWQEYRVERNAELIMTEPVLARLQQIDEELGRLERDYAHREAYGEAGPKLQQLLRAIAILRHERESLSGTLQLTET